MKHFTKILLAAGALAVSALSHAAPVINWDVTASGTWTGFTSSTGTGAGVSQPNSSTLQWGTSTGSGQSSLVITNPAKTNIPTWYGGGTPTAGFIAPQHCTDTLEQPHYGKNVDERRVDGRSDPEADEPHGPQSAAAQYQLRHKVHRNAERDALRRYQPCRKPLQRHLCAGGWLSQRVFRV